MATSQSQSVGKWALAPSVLALSGWAFIPLVLTIYFAFLRYNLQDPDNTRWFGVSNFYYFMSDPYFIKDLIHTLVLVFATIVTTIVGGTLLALLLDQKFWGRGIVRLLMFPRFSSCPRCLPWFGKTY